MAQPETTERHLEAYVFRVESEAGKGTAFLVGRSVAITCGHVVGWAPPGTAVKLYHGATEYDASVVVSIPDSESEQPRSLSMPDLTLLRIKHYYAERYLEFGEECLSDDTLVVRGFSKTFEHGDSVRPTFEGEFVRAEIGGHNALMKMKGAQFEAGLSGAPVFNARTGRVVGMVNASRNVTAAAGATAIPAKTILFFLDGLIAESVNLLGETIEGPASGNTLGVRNAALLHSSWYSEKWTKILSEAFVPARYYRVNAIVVAPSSVLDRIKRVTYFLPPSWPDDKQKQIGKPRSENFLFRETANGTFVLVAKLEFHDQTTPVWLNRFITLSEHELVKLSSTRYKRSDEDWEDPVVP